jgi:TatD DNase family protein
MFIDTHTHLDHSKVDADELLDAAWDVDVRMVVQSGTDLESSRWAAALAHRRLGVAATIGVHPQDATNATDAAMAGLEALAADPAVVGIGETGFDFFHDYCPHEQQERAFARHMQLAGAAGLPLVVHTRDAADITLTLLERHGVGLTVILHCFSLPDRLEDIVARGYYISFAGNVTYKSAVDLQAAAQTVPERLLLVETDAPYLTPVPVRGRPNSPALVTHTYEFIARLRGMSTGRLADLVVANARRAFPRLSEAIALGRAADMDATTGLGPEDERGGVDAG